MQVLRSGGNKNRENVKIFKVWGSKEKKSGVVQKELAGTLFELQG